MAKTTILESPVKSSETVAKAQEDALSAEELAQNKRMKELYEKQAENVRNQAAVLAQNQQAATDLAVSQLEQRKTQLKEDYKKEQSAAYTDYQKQINPYGANAEVMAENGLTNSGYSESSKVRMYNEYQQRVAMNKSTLNAAIANFDNAIAEAKLQNSSALAQMAFDAFEQEVALLEQAELYAVKQQGASASSVGNVGSGGVTAPSGYAATGDTVTSPLNEEQLKVLKREFAINSMNGTDITTLQRIDLLMSIGAIDETTGLSLLEEFVPNYEDLMEIAKKL